MSSDRFGLRLFGRLPAFVLLFLIICASGRSQSTKDGNADLRAKLGKVEELLKKRPNDVALLKTKAELLLTLRDYGKAQEALFDGLDTLLKTSRQDRNPTWPSERALFTLLRKLAAERKRQIENESILAAKKLAALAAEVSQLKKAILAASKLRKELEQAYQKKLAFAEEELKNAKTSAAKLRKDLKMAQDLLEKTQASLKDLKTKHATLTATLKKKDALNGVLEQQLQKSRQRLAALQKELDIAQKRQEELTVVVAKLKAEITETKRQLAAEPAAGTPVADYSPLHTRCLIVFRAPDDAAFFIDGKQVDFGKSEPKQVLTPPIPPSGSSEYHIRVEFRTGKEKPVVGRSLPVKRNEEIHVSVDPKGNFQVVRMPLSQRALVIVAAPREAELLVNGIRHPDTGKEIRKIITPPIPETATFDLEIEARRNGAVLIRRFVTVSRGETLHVDFSTSH